MERRCCDISVFFTSTEGTSKAIEVLVVRNADSSFQPTAILASPSTLVPPMSAHSR